MLISMVGKVNEYERGEELEDSTYFERDSTLRWVDRKGGMGRFPPSLASEFIASASLTLSASAVKRP